MNHLIQAARNWSDYKLKQNEVIQAYSKSQGHFLVLQFATIAPIHLNKVERSLVLNQCNKAKGRKN